MYHPLRSTTVFQSRNQLVIYTLTFFLNFFFSIFFFFTILCTQISCLLLLFKQHIDLKVEYVKKNVWICTNQEKF